MCSGSTGRVGPVAKPGCPDGPRRTALAMTSREEDGATLRLLETTGKSQERPRRRVRRSLRRRQPKRCGDGRAECSVQNVAAHRELITARLPESTINSIIQNAACIHRGRGAIRRGVSLESAGPAAGYARSTTPSTCETESPKVGAKSRKSKSRESKSREPKVESQRKSESPKVEQSKSSLSPSPRSNKSETSEMPDGGVKCAGTVERGPEKSRVFFYHTRVSKRQPRWLTRAPSNAS